MQSPDERLSGEITDLSPVSPGRSLARFELGLFGREMPESRVDASAVVAAFDVAGQVALRLVAAEAMRWLEVEVSMAFVGSVRQAAHEGVGSATAALDHVAPPQAWFLEMNRSTASAGSGRLNR